MTAHTADGAPSLEPRDSHGVMRTAALHGEEARLLALRSALVDGENSGPPEVFDLDAFLGSRKV